MNELAEVIINRDDAPFPKTLDTVVFVPDSVQEGSTGNYQLVRTSAEGIATQSEFIAAFDENADQYSEVIDGDIYAVGSPVAGHMAPGRVLARGVISTPPFFTIKRTPNLCVPGQTTGRPGETRKYNPRAQKFNYYVGSLWLTVDYDEDGLTPAHTSLLSLRRRAQSTEVQRTHMTNSILFGEENIHRALAAAFART